MRSVSVSEVMVSVNGSTDNGDYVRGVGPPPRVGPKVTPPDHSVSGSREVNGPNRPFQPPRGDEDPFAGDPRVGPTPRDSTVRGHVVD